jgi:hypothetical protein
MKWIQCVELAKITTRAQCLVLFTEHTRPHSKFYLEVDYGSGDFRSAGAL